MLRRLSRSTLFPYTTLFRSLRHGSDKTLQVGYANHFYRSAHKFEQICRHRLRRQNVGYSNFSQPQSHLSFCVLLQYLVERRRVVTQLGKLDSTTSIDIMGLQAAYANLHTDQERDYFMQRYHDVISSFGGKTSYDADNRPLLVMRSNLWASGYDVDGTDQTSLGQFSGRVQQTYKHSVPRFFVPEHGTM